MKQGDIYARAELCNLHTPTQKIYFGSGINRYQSATSYHDLADASDDIYFHFIDDGDIRA